MTDVKAAARLTRAPLVLIAGFAAPLATGSALRMAVGSLVLVTVGSGSWVMHVAVGRRPYVESAVRPEVLAPTDSR